MIKVQFRKNENELQSIDNSEVIDLYNVTFGLSEGTVTFANKTYIKYPTSLEFAITSYNEKVVKNYDAANNLIGSNTTQTWLPVTIDGIDFGVKSESPVNKDKNEKTITFNKINLKGIPGKRTWKVTISNSYEVFIFYLVGQLTTYTTTEYNLSIAGDEEHSANFQNNTITFQYLENLTSTITSYFNIRSNRIDTTYFDPDNNSNVKKLYYSSPIQLKEKLPISLSSTINVDVASNSTKGTNDGDFYFRVNCKEVATNVNAQEKNETISIIQTDPKSTAKEVKFTIIQKGQQSEIIEDFGNNPEAAEQVFTSYMLYHVTGTAYSSVTSTSYFDAKESNVFDVYSNIDTTLANPIQVEKLFWFTKDPDKFEFKGSDWINFYNHQKKTKNDSPESTYIAFKIKNFKINVCPSYYKVLADTNSDDYKLSSYEIPINIELLNAYSDIVSITEEQAQGNSNTHNYDIHVMPKAWTDQENGLTGSEFYYKKPDEYFTTIKEKSKLKTAITSTNKDSYSIWTDTESAGCDQIRLKTTVKDMPSKIDGVKWYSNTSFKNCLAYNPLTMCIPITWNQQMLYNTALDYYSKHYDESSKGYIGPEDHNGISIRPENKNVNLSYMPESAQKAIKEAEDADDKDDKKQNSSNNDLGVQDVPPSSSTQLKMIISGFDGSKITGLTDIGNCVAECDTDKGITSLSVDITISDKMKALKNAANDIGEGKTYAKAEDVPEYKIATITVYGFYNGDESTKYFAGSAPGDEKVTSIFEGDGVKFDPYWTMNSKCISGNYAFNGLIISLNIHA